MQELLKSEREQAYSREILLKAKHQAVLRRERKVQRVVKRGLATEDESLVALRELAKVLGLHAD